MMRTHPPRLTTFRASILILVAACAAVSAALLLPALRANAADYSTALLSPTSTNPPNQWTNPNNAFTSDNQRATETTDGERQGYDDFHIPTIPSNAIIRGIEVVTEARSTDSSGCRIFVALSWNKSSVTSNKTVNLTGSDTLVTVGSPTDTWGRTWSPGEFTNANFMVRVEFDDPGSACTGNAELDHIQVRVHYYIVDTPVVDNPGLPNECVGADVHLVIDSSGSIGSALGSMQTAIKSMIDQVESQLPDSNWRGTTFRDPSGSPPVINSSAGGWQTSTTNTKTLIDGMTANGYTPTAHGIATAIAGGTNGPQPNIMLIITDGAPNVVYPGGDAPPANYFGGADSAIAQAEAARAAGWNTIVIMFGPGDSSAPGGTFVSEVLQGLAGPIANPGPPGDVYPIADASDLGDAIAAALLANCQGSITIEKQTTPNGSTQTFNFTATPGNFSLQDNQTHLDDNLTPGQTYTYTETVPSGWTLTSINCSGGVNITINLPSVSIDLENGEDVHCVFNNTQLNTMQICKNVIPDSDTSEWDFTVSGPTPGSVLDLADNECETLTDRAAGSYTITETAQAGYTTTVNCGAKGSDTDNDITFTLNSGENASCTFTNTSTASIQVCKDVVPDDATTWNFTLTGPTGGAAGPLSDGQCHTFGNRAPGSYTLTETTQAGYSASVSCDAGNGSDTDADITFTLSPGETTTCTFTNQGVGTIEICKDVVPGDSSTWNFTVTGPSGGSAGPLGDGQCQTLTNRNAGSYTIQETTQAGYDTTVNCGPNGSDVDANITFTLSPGESASCTFTNTSTAKIKVCKNVVPDDGGLTSWVFTLTGPTPGSTPPLIDNGCFTFANRAPGSYTLQETTQAGYTTSVNCGANGSDADADITFTLDPGEAAHCTFTNTSTASIQVCKQIVPAHAGAWNFTVTGPSGGAVGPLGDGQCQTLTNRTPGSYTVAETAQAGYSTSVNCGANGSNATNTITFTLDPGENATCTFTNTSTASIQVCKDVVPDDASTWNFTLTGPTGGAAGPLGDGQCHTFSNRAPGSYTLTETTQAAYDTSVNCGPNGSNGTNSITFTLDPGENASCTFTNTKKGTIQVCKDVVPDDASTWNFTVTGPSGGAVGPLGDGQCQTLTNQTAGSYTVTETTQAGYTTSVNCGPNGSNATNSITFTLDPGESASCTFTNTAAPGSIQICKDVVPDGDTSEWDFTVSGPTPGSVLDLADNECETLTGRAAGTYTVTETTQTGYTTSVNCGPNGSDSDADITFVLSIGESASCTFTNTSTASIQVCKDVVPDDASTWNFTLAGPTGGAAGPLGDGQCHTFSNRAPGSYTLTETTQAGYTTSVNCGPNGSNGTNSITFTLDPGESASCTFTNTAVGTIQICKDVVPNDASTWSFTVTGPSGGAVGPLGDGQCQTLTNQTVGSYTVTETTQTGYATSVNCGPNGSNATNSITFTLDLGENASCTFTNTSTASIQICKNVVPDDGGLTMWDFTVSGPTPGTVDDLADNGCLTLNNRAPGSYTVAEVTQAGYTTSVNCGANGSDSDADHTFTLDPGENASCTFTNTSTASIQICKQISPPDGSTWNFTVTGPSGGSVGPLGHGQCQTLTNRTPGNYTVTETADPNYSTAVNCGPNGSEADADITFALSPGESASCTFTNTANPGSIQICKNVTPVGSMWNFTVSGPSPGSAGPLGNGQCQTLTSRTPGVYTVTETTQPGYNTSVNCGANGSDTDADITFTLSPGEAASCTFTNIAQTGSIQICKQISPPDGSTWNFNVAGPTAGSAGPLGHGQCQTLTNRQTGSYTVTETTQSGYTTSVNCGPNGSDSDADITFTLDPGENASCTFTNTATPASIQVCKNVEPTDASTWNFQVTGPSGGAVGPLGDGQCQTLNNQTPGSYTVTETTQPGYNTSVDCGANGSDTDNNITFTLDPGEAATCTFLNVPVGSIQICKDVVPDDASTWNFTVAGPTAGAAGPLGDGQCQTLTNRVAGNYTITETPDASYTTSVNCGVNGSDTDNNITINLSANEAAVCTFTNVFSPVLNDVEFLVYKDFTDGNTIDVNITLVCVPGSVTNDDPSASEADPANFTVNGASLSTTCTATENPIPPGYAVDISDCLSVPLSQGSCTIVNEPLSGEIGGTPHPVGGEAGLINSGPADRGGGAGVAIALTAAGALAAAAGAAWAVTRSRLRTR